MGNRTKTGLVSTCFDSGGLFWVIAAHFFSISRPISRFRTFVPFAVKSHGRVICVEVRMNSFLCTVFGMWTGSSSWNQKKDCDPIFTRFETRPFADGRLKLSKILRTRRNFKRRWNALSKVQLAIFRQFWAMCKKVTLCCRFWISIFWRKWTSAPVSEAPKNCWHNSGASNRHTDQLWRRAVPKSPELRLLEALNLTTYKVVPPSSKLVYNPH